MSSTFCRKTFCRKNVVNDKITSLLRQYYDKTGSYEYDKMTKDIIFITLFLTKNAIHMPIFRHSKTKICIAEYFDISFVRITSKLE